MGRISPKKDYKTLIGAVSLLEDKSNLEVKIYGQIGLAEQKEHFDKLKDLVKEQNLENSDNSEQKDNIAKIKDNLSKFNLGNEQDDDDKET